MGRHQEESAWNVECKTHGLLPTAADKNSCAMVVAQHWILMHHGAGAAIEGRDWMSYPALQRCDACGVPVEPPYWAHTTIDGPLGQEMIDLDGRWLLCDACHRHFTADKLGAWVRHWLAVSRTLTDYPNDPDVATAMRAEIAKRLRILLNCLDAGTRFPW